MKIEKFRDWIKKGKRTIGEAYEKLHSLFDEKSSLDIKLLHSQANSNELYLFYH